MYKLKYNNLLIYDPSQYNSIANLTLRDAATHLAVGEPGSLSFTLEHDHPNADRIDPLSGTVELQSDGVVLYRGRVTNITKDFDNAKTFETEGLLACLNDSVVPPYSFPEDYAEDPDYIAAAASGNVVEFWLSKLLANHNAHVSAAQQISLGTVTVEDSNNYIARESSDYSTTWNVIQDKLVGTLGGYLLVRYESNGTYLDYYADLPLANTQPVEFAYNLLDLVTSSDATEIFTAIVPIGAEGMTISSLPDGALTADLVKDGDTIYSTDGIAAYGRITRVEKWDDVTVPENLRSKAATRLAEALTMPSTITVKAADLHGSEADVANFRVGRYTQLQSPPHGFSALWPLMELDPDILDPGNTQITLGQTLQSQADLLKARAAAQADRSDQQQLELDQQQRSINDLIATTEEQITTAIQTSESLILSALQNYVATGDFEEFRESVQAQLSVMANSVTIQLSTTTEYIESLSDDLNAKYENFTKFFRFTEDGLFIGEEGNEVLLRLDNDIMQFIRENIPELYLDDGGVHANYVEATQTIKIGSFILSADPDGRVSFRKET